MCKCWAQMVAIGFSIFLACGGIEEVVAAELTLEASWCGQLAYPNRIACDHMTHLIYATSPRTGQIAVYDESGSLQTNIATVQHPSAIACDGADHLFVVDGNMVRKLSTDGTVLMSIGEDGGTFMNPHDVAVTQDGRIFVADADDSIHVFGGSGEFLFAFGGHGYFGAQLDNPVSLDVDNAKGELFVSDQNNSRVQVFSTNGTHLRSWGSLGTGLNTAGAFLRPWGIDRDAEGEIWVYDGVLNSLQVFDSTGASESVCLLQLAAPLSGVDIAVDNGKIFVTDQSAQCIQVYHKTIPASVCLTIACSDEGPVLHWNSVPDADGYVIVRSGDVQFNALASEPLGTVTDTFFVDAQAVDQFDIRFYQVTPVNSAERTAVSSTSSPMRRNLRGDRHLDTQHDSPHTVDAGVNCTSCHFPEYSYPDPFSEAWCAERLCKSCHVETGKASPAQDHFAGADTVYCNICHNPHFQQQQFPHDFIRTAITTTHSGDRALSFENATDFIHGAPTYDGICETCHTATLYYRNNASGDHTHHSGENCLNCHTHLSGFIAASQTFTQHR
jgi:DNA-binding beta-propeller fold protein YncE